MDASIIIPTFNRLWSLPETVASCPRGDGVEVIVVDDGSTDGTWDWLSRQDGIVAIRQENWGKAAAATTSFAAARGRYIRFLDSDDLLIAEQATAQLRFATQQDADICVAGYWASYEATGGRVLHDWRDCGDFLAQQLGECDSSHYSAYLFRRDFIADVFHRPEYSVHDDRMFILECALKSPKVVAWAQPTLVHRHHDQPRTQFQRGSTQVVANWQDLRMFRKMESLLDSRGLSTPRRRAAMAHNVWELALRIAAYDRAEAREVIRWMRTLRPDFEIPSHGLHRLYRTLGFPVAQTIVNGGRTLRNTARAARRRVDGMRAK